MSPEGSVEAIKPPLEGRYLDEKKGSRREALDRLIETCAKGGWDEELLVALNLAGVELSTEHVDTMIDYWLSAEERERGSANRERLAHLVTLGPGASPSRRESAFQLLLNYEFLSDELLPLASYLGRELLESEVDKLVELALRDCEGSAISQIDVLRSARVATVVLGLGYSERAASRLIDVLIRVHLHEEIPSIEAVNPRYSELVARATSVEPKDESDEEDSPPYSLARLFAAEPSAKERSVLVTRMLQLNRSEEDQIGRYIRDIAGMAIQAMLPATTLEGVLVDALEGGYVDVACDLAKAIGRELSAGEINELSESLRCSDASQEPD